MESKQNRILKLFFNEPTREWHFEEILKIAKITRGKAANWLRKLSKEKIITRVKEKSKMPYYVANHSLPEYKNLKKLYALEQFHKSGFLNHLTSLKKARAIILFGSFARSDWNGESDIDLFIYGDPDGLKIMPYELELNHEIQLFLCKNPKDLKKYGSGMLRNIIKGMLIRGEIDFLKVESNA